MLAGCLYSVGFAAEFAAEDVQQGEQNQNQQDGQNQNEAPAAPAPITENGVTYMSGGIGANEANEMKRAAKKYDLMLTFATKERGEYVADVKVDIQNAKGQNVLSTVSDGPILLADLPPGKYKIKAETEGKQIVKNVYVSGKAPVKMALLWPRSLVETPPPA